MSPSAPPSRRSISQSSVRYTRSCSTTSSAARTSARTAASSGSGSPTPSRRPALCQSSSSSRNVLPFASASSSTKREPGPQPLRVVELDAERAGDPVGDLEADARQLGEPVRIFGEHGDDVFAVLAHEPAGEPRADPVAVEERLDLADRRDLAPGGDRTLDALREIARPAFVRTSRSRSGLRSSSSKTFSAPKCSTIARANVARRRGRASRARARFRLRSAAASSGRTRPTNCMPCRGCSAYAPVQTSWSPGVDVSERAGERDRLAVAILAERRRPDGELRVGRDVARPGGGA